MDKRLLLIGIVLIIGSVLIGSAVLPKPPTPKEFSAQVIIAPNSFSYSSLHMNATDFLELYYSATSPIDFYLLNSTGFDYFESSNSTIVFNSITAGDGVLYETLNSTLGAMPYESNYTTNVTKPAYESSNISIYPTGNYFLLFSNMRNGASNVTYGYVSIPVNQLISSTLPYNGAYQVGSIAAAAIFIAGVVIAFLSLFRSQAKKPEAMVDTEAKRLYAKIDSKASTKRKIKPHRKRKTARK